MINLSRVFPKEDILKRRIKLHFRRFEFKYLVSSEQKNAIVKQIKPFMYLDPFVASGSSYLITSLYLDSPALTFYRQNEAGLPERKKIRFRHYDNNQHILFKEIKRKHQDIIYKDRVLSGGPSDSLIETEIRYLTKLLHLRPTLWIKYNRQPWIDHKNNLRITFDSDISAASAKFITSQKAKWFKKILPGLNIMELKFDGKLPWQIFNIISKHSLVREALSKYRLAIEKLGMI